MTVKNDAAVRTLTDLIACEPHWHGSVVAGVGAPSGRVDAAQLPHVVLHPALRLALQQSLRLALAERRDVLERAYIIRSTCTRIHVH